MIRNVGPSSDITGFDFWQWWDRVGSSVTPTISTMWEKYTIELARSLADWTPALIALGLLAIIAVARGGKGKDEFDSEEDSADGMMGVMFGGGPGAKKPRLMVRSWNRQIDRFALATTRATKGREETRELQRRFEDAYVEWQRGEVAFTAKASQMSSGETKQSPAAVLKEPTEELAPRRVWVLKFQGGRNDVTASGVQQLREEITAVVMAADPGRDEVVLRLDSPGGTVTGYGLAGAQLMRLRDAGLNLTVAIDQVAASGGYLMACTANRIICSPFAVIGSIGVVQELPIVFDRLQREGIQFETTTAGKYKRTLTPFKQPTDEDRLKNKEDIEDVLGVFKEFVSASRPTVDIEAVATGETWIGPRAKDQGLVDELKTSDALLLDYARAGCQVLLVNFTEQGGSPLQRVLQGAVDTAGALCSDAAFAVADRTGVTAGLLPRSSAWMPMAKSPRGDWMARRDDWDAMS